MNISTQTIFRFLHGREFVLPIDTSEFDYCIEEIRKVKSEQIGTDDKYMPLKWIMGIITIAQEDTPLVVAFKGQWKQHLALAKFFYNNKCHLSIKMSHFEVLYGRHC